MKPTIDFLYLNEEDTIQAGVLEIKKCVDTMVEMLELMGKGDYLMGGPNANSHGIKIYFPVSSPFPKMPIKGPDRRFMALVGYLGGRFHVCGEKWYGSNIQNKEKKLPRSILTLTLNDPDTGAPLVYMSANKLSAVRTGAMPGVASRYLAKKDAKTLGIVGAGVIGKASLEAIIAGCPSIEKIKIYDLYQAQSQEVCHYVQKQYQLDAMVINSVESAVRDSDIINFATAGTDTPVIQADWIKPGALITLPGSADIDKAFFIKQKIVVDNWKMYEAYADEQKSLPGTFSEKNSGICGSLMDYIFQKELSKEKVINIGDIIAKNKIGRSNEEEIIFFIADGMCVQDIAWAYEVYQNALKNNIGTLLKLF